MGIFKTIHSASIKVAPIVQDNTYENMQMRSSSDYIYSLFLASDYKQRNERYIKKKKLNQILTKFLYIMCKVKKVVVGEYIF